jgi:hypothetical protein
VVWLACFLGHSLKAAVLCRTGFVVAIWLSRFVWSERMIIYISFD